MTTQDVILTITLMLGGGLAAGADGDEGFRVRARLPVGSRPRSGPGVAG